MPYYRKPIRKVWAMRDQYVNDVRQYISVLVSEMENGDLIEGTERCSYVIQGNPFEKCPQCGHDITHSPCHHSGRTQVKRCGKKAWFISTQYGHTLCEVHKAREDYLTVEDLDGWYL